MNLEFTCVCVCVSSFQGARPRNDLLCGLRPLEGCGNYRHILFNITFCAAAHSGDGRHADGAGIVGPNSTTD